MREFQQILINWKVCATELRSLRWLCLLVLLSVPPCDAFAQSAIRILQSAIGNPYLFQGARYDAETGFYYFRNRYYDPRAGRFLQRDPIWDEQNVGGWYSFVGNSPLSRRDPLGLDDDEPFDPNELRALQQNLEAARRGLDLNDEEQLARLRKAKNQLQEYLWKHPGKPGTDAAQALVEIADSLLFRPKGKTPGTGAAGCPPSDPSKADATSKTWNQLVEAVTRYVHQQKQRFEKKAGEDVTEEEQRELDKLERLSSSAEAVRDYYARRIACEDPQAQGRVLTAMTELTRFFGGEVDPKGKATLKFDEIKKELKEALKAADVNPTIIRGWFRSFEQERRSILKTK